MKGNNFVVKIPRDLSTIESKLMFGLTKRQLIGFGSAVIIFGLNYFLLYQFSVDIALIVGMIFASPIVFITLYKKDKLYAEEWIKLIIQNKYLYENKRMYKLNKNNINIAKKKGYVYERKK